MTQTIENGKSFSEQEERKSILARRTATGKAVTESVVARIPGVLL